jgi:hypothetical protein
MSTSRNRVCAAAFAVAIVLVSNPELFALLLTVQAIGVESMLLLLSLQARSTVNSLKDPLLFIGVARRAIVPKIRYLAGLMLFLCPSPDHPAVLRQLLLLSALCFRSTTFASSRWVR